jgi:1-deoxy-D-xylulose-5-phosphate reductoisomerase
MFPERFRVTALAARQNADRLLELAGRFGARRACLKSPSKETVRLFAENGVELMSGGDGLESIAELPDVDHVVFASSGTDAITALQKALSADKDVSLANKESIVAAGPWVMDRVRRADQLRPLDSEHSAIWQCLRGEPGKNISRVLLTASGGPFRDMSVEQMRTITPRDALRHPVWNMGDKITVDSATLMNKGIECVEAMRLFDLPPEKVGAVVHPATFIHGIVVFSDATMKLLAYKPDMRIPAASALAWPERPPMVSFNEFSPPALDEWKLDFREPDPVRFPCLAIAMEAGRKGGAYPPLLIGADESAVRAFLSGRVPFLAISHIIERSLEMYSGQNPSSLADAMELISAGERAAEELCSAIGG